MNLKLKHLAGYLPYGLEFYVPFLILSGNPPEPSHEECGGQEMDCKNINELMESGFSPILRPLSSLTKEIEVNGKKFVPIEELFKIQWGGTHHLSDKNKHYTVAERLFIKCSHNSSAMQTSVNIKYPLNNNYWKIEKLLEWHFDIHNLIENNLAIEKI